jgi:2-polyprenyl-6-methoxyphenol hydroxylase-like FAD-dependent oxidoreductase
MLPTSTDVLVIGAGPTGLTTAVSLAQQGHDVTVVDNQAAGDNTSRAAVVHARTLEVLEPLEVAERLTARGLHTSRFTIRDRDRVLVPIGFGRLPTRYPYILMISQAETERVLLDRLTELGGRVARPYTLRAIDQDDAGVTAVFTDGSRIRADYLVGSDGMHSTVREQAGIGFPGGSYAESFALADVRLSGGLPSDEAILYFSPDGLVVIAPLPGGAFRVVATVDDGAIEPDAAFVQRILDTRGPRRERAVVREVIWGSRFRVHHRIADEFRSGRVFLAGDAAHVHSPAGGQGMNTGIQDAANLAWKLALVVRGRAPGSLLDSYERERRPVARGVVSTTDRLTRLATVRSPLLRRLRNALIPIAGRAGRLPRRLATNLSELDVSYRAGWSVDGSKTVERWAPKGQGVLSGLDPTLTLVVTEQQGTRAAEEAARFRTLPVRVVQRTRLGHAALVRPDGYVAGRVAPEQHPRLLELLARALGA